MNQQPYSGQRNQQAQQQGQHSQGYGQQRQQQQQHHNNNDDDCCGDCKCDDCGECCGDCKGCCDCECTECGCDCLKTMNTTICQSCTCCACMACCSSGDILTELNFKHQEFNDEEEQQQLLKEFKNVIQMYKNQKRIQHPHLGECMQLQIKKTVSLVGQPQKIFMKNTWILSSQEYHKQIRFWHQITLNRQNEGIVKILAVYGAQIPDLCVDRWRITLLIEKVTPIEQHIESGKPVQIPKAMHQLTQGLKFLHAQNGEYHSEQAYFHISRVYLNSNHDICLLPPYMDFQGNAKFDSLKAKHVNDNPENQILTLIKSKKLAGILPSEVEQSQENDFDKVDVWMLGIQCFMLSVGASIKDLKEDGDDKFQLNPIKYQQLQLKLGQKVSYPVQTLIESMLKQNPDDRLDLAKVIQRLTPIMLNDYPDLMKPNIKRGETSMIQSRLPVPMQQQQLHYSNQVVPQSLSVTPRQPLNAQVETVDRQLDTKGAYYTGQKVNNKKSGYGRLEFKDGSGYEGNWKDDKMHGEGVLYYQQGKIAYKGTFLEDRFHGFGHLFSAQVRDIVGPWNYKDMRKIDGFWTKYEGDFKADKKSGYGILYLSNGEKWAGEFKDDLPDGFGTFYRSYIDYQDGDEQNIKMKEEKVSGNWKGGELISIC